MENKNSQTIRKEDLDIGTKYPINIMKCVKTKYENKIVITINFKGEVVDIFAPKRFYSTAADLQRN